MDPADIQLPPQAIQAIEQGRMIEAIKILRRQHAGLDLAAAKGVVDAYVAAHPSLKGRRATVSPGSGSIGRIATIALVIVAAALAYLKAAGKF